MMSSKTLVKLAAGKDEREFTISHAQRILNRKKGGWELTDSKFILDKDGNIKKKSNGNSKED